MNIRNNRLVSVIIPAYNAERFIERALRSAVGQTYNDVEIIVIDDGSTDATAELVRNFGDPRISYHFQKNQGQGKARNHGILLSKGAYISFLDADDMYLPEKIDKQVRFLEQHPEYAVVYCNALHFVSGNARKLYRKKRKASSGDMFRSLLHSSLINPNTPMFRAEILKDGLMFREGIYGRYSEEWELYLRIVRTGFAFYHLDEDLVVVEIREDSTTQWHTQWIFKKNTLEMFETLFAQMSKEEREFYEADKILRRNRLKLALSYLIARRRKEFVGTFASVFSLRLLGYLSGSLLLAVPPVLFRKLWKLNQFRHWDLVKRDLNI